jgi:hypothetical protein
MLIPDRDGIIWAKGAEALMRDRLSTVLKRRLLLVSICVSLCMVYGSQTSVADLSSVNTSPPAPKIWGAFAPIKDGRSRVTTSLQRHSADAVPLWTFLPTREFAVLGEDLAPSRRWGVYAFRGSQRGRQVACVEIVTLRYTDGPSNGFSVLTSEPACRREDRLRRPILAETTFSEDRGGVLALIVVGSVSEVELRLSQGYLAMKKTRLLNAHQAQRAHLKPIRYLATGIPQGKCVREVRGFDANDVQQFEISTHECS